MNESRLRTLILALIYPNRVSYYDDWRDAFEQHPGYECTVRNIMTLTPDQLRQEIDTFDAVILLHSCNSDTLDYFAPLAPVLAERRRAKVATFVGNEFNFPYVSTAERVRLFATARCDIVATQLLQEAGDHLYAASGARIVSMPHALNPVVFTPGPEKRERDIGVRGYKYPPYLGDDDRNTMMRFFSENGARLGLSIDVGEDKRLDRADWARFLQTSYGTITTETGSWYISPNDELIDRIYAYLKSKRSGIVISNESPLRRAARHLPSPVKAVLWRLLQKGPIGFEVLDDYNTSFEELNEVFFKHEPRAPAYGKAISSRHFDAIGAGTCQIAYRGRFNDIMVADEHYLALERDLSNADAVIARFNDRGERSRIASAAYEMVMAGHTYRHRAEAMLACLT